MIRPFIQRSLLAACLAFATGAGAQTVEEVAASAKADLQKALDELARVQQQIGEEKIPLAQKLNAAEDAVLNRRKELEKAQRSAENQLVELNVLKSEVKSRRDELAFLNSLLGEYVRLFETRTHISEVPRYAAVVGDVKAAASNPDLAPAEKVAKQAAILHTSLDRLEGLLGGETFAGRALSPQGRMEPGKFTLVGPVALFAGDAGDIAGLAELQLGSPEPSVIDLGPAQTAQIKTLVAQGTGDLPFDATGGNALKIAATRDGFIEHILKGGPVMWPIIALALAAAIVAVIKWVQITRIRIATPMDLQKILSHIGRGERAQAMALAQGITGPTGELLVAAVEHVGEKKEYIEEVLYEVMLNTKPKLERLLPFLMLTAAAAPLLGLLGTVTGMINTFNMISVFGTGDPKTLSSGISEALITTEWGLYVAIPALLSQAILSRKVKHVLGSMEQLTVGFINGVPDKEETFSL
jgi:biopolymer transport protein ExbB